MMLQKPPVAKPADYKSALKPVWCPGCGDFGVVAALTRAFHHMKLAKEDIAIISGIGCSGRLPAYLDVYGLHGLHGRALPVAQGLKIARPELTVIAAGGDGDMYSIGTNHFIHACRRNVDITVIIMDNRIYGMTKGQPSPTTEPDVPTAMQPDGTGLPPLNGMLLALAANASFVARGFTGDPNGLAGMIEEAIRHPGFAVLEVLSPCATFRPEQSEWKRQVERGVLTPAATLAEAMQQVMQAPELSTGIVWRQQRPAEPAMEQAPARDGLIAEIHAGFRA